LISIIVEMRVDVFHARSQSCEARLPLRRSLFLWSLARISLTAYALL